MGLKRIECKMERKIGKPIAFLFILVLSSILNFGLLKITFRFYIRATSSYALRILNSTKT